MDPTFGTVYTDTLKIMQQDAASTISKLESVLNGLKIPTKTEVLVGVSRLMNHYLMLNHTKLTL
jgi:CRISPR/Cas system CMR subunit Cmr6 (Cas7 group RAMP superfamily)